MDVYVNVARAGTGSVTVRVVVAPGTAAEIEDLRAGLPVDDLRRAGWVVRGPDPTPSGATEVSVSHAFSALSQLPVLMADIAGTGPARQRPFRLVVTEQRGSLRDDFRATGTVDLRCSLACFDDPALAAHVGYPLGLPPAELTRLLGARPARVLTFRFQLALPGNRADASSVLVLSPVLGDATPFTATAVSVNVAFLQRLVAAVSAGALVVLSTAMCLLWRHRRRRGRRARPGFASQATGSLTQS